jgi:hypothetical protein
MLRSFFRPIWPSNASLTNFCGLVFWFASFCVLYFFKMEVEVSPPTEITPSTSTNGNNGANNGGSNKDGNNPGAYVLPFPSELIEVNRVPSSGQRIKLQVEVKVLGRADESTDYKFLTICDPASSISSVFTYFYFPH